MITLKILGIAWLLTNGGNFLDEANVILKDWKQLKMIPIKIMNCLMCSSFWVSIIMIGDIGFAGVISLLAFAIDKYIISSPTEL